MGSEYKRGYQDGSAGRRPAELSKKYLKGYRKGRSEYLTPIIEAKRMGWIK